MPKNKPAETAESTSFGSSAVFLAEGWYLRKQQQY